MDEKFIITSEQIEELRIFIRSRAYGSARNILMQLPKLEDSEDIKTLEKKIKELESQLNKKEVKNGIA